MDSYLVLRVVAKLLMPFILIYGLYVQFHGDFGPGGGFQDIKFESLWRFAPCKLRYPELREAG